MEKRMMFRKLNILFAFLALFAYPISPAMAGIVGFYHLYSTNDTVTSTNLNGNFQNIINEMNGDLDNNNAATSRGFRFIEILDALPAAGNQGRIVFLTADNLLHYDTGTSFLTAPVYTGTAAQGDIMYFNGTIWSLLNKSTSGVRFISNQGTSNNPTWSLVDLTSAVTGILPVASGGTGVSSVTDGGLLIGKGTSPFENTGVLGNGTIVVGDGTTNPATLGAFTSSTGTLKHESGGIEADISAVVKGDLITGTGTGTMALKNVGSDDTVLVASSGTAGGVKWQKVAEENLGASAVDQTALKTSTGEVSTASSANLTLPGGQYGFYPQVKIGASGVWKCGIAIDPMPTSYTTNIGCEEGSGTDTVYAQQRYVTASGKDWWIFLLVDETTGVIDAAYSAADHPAYGNGDDPDIIKNPFQFNDLTGKKIIVLNDVEVAKVRSAAIAQGKSMLTLVNERKKVDLTRLDKYTPTHIGTFDEDGNPILLNELPSGIEARPLIDK